MFLVTERLLSIAFALFIYQEFFLVAADNVLQSKVLRSARSYLCLLFLFYFLLVLMLISFSSCFPKNAFTFCVKLQQPYCLLSLAIFPCHLAVSGPLSDFSLFSRCYTCQRYKLISSSHYPHCFGLGAVVKPVK